MMLVLVRRMPLPQGLVTLFKFPIKLLKSLVLLGTTNMSYSRLLAHAISQDANVVKPMEFNVPIPARA